MTIPLSDWLKFIRTLSALNNKAAGELARYIDRQGGLDSVDRDALINYAYGLVTKYGEGATAAAAEMYDAIAVLSGANVPPAVPAATATYAETAKAINGTLKTGNEEIVSGAVGRMVKMAGVDTTMQNALRDGAEWAWIPMGDTCAFCIALASRGWQRASKKALKGGHAEHIHANCDCTYAIRFDDSEVEGYDPEKYRKMYSGADGDTPRERINAMRREFYARNKTVLGPGNPEAEEFNVSRRSPPAFKPAASIDEAQNFAAQFTNGSRYAKVDYSGIDLQYANEFNRAMNDVLTQYDPKYKLREIGAMNMREKAFRGSTADAAYRWGSCDLFYNKAYFKSPKDFAKHLQQYRDLLEQVLPNVDPLIEKYRSETGYGASLQLRYLEALKATGRTNVSSADPYRTMVHELGHYLDDNLFRAEFKSSGFDVRQSFADYAIRVSAYATESNQEYVAESFLAYWVGETDGLDPELVKIFERLRQ